MSYKDMFRKEQRFSFRKFSFGLASAVIANVILGGAIANSPVVHANTVTEAQATAVSERIASIPYTVKIEDQTGKVVETKVKMVSVYTVEAIATATDYLTADLVPEGYAIVSGLGEVTVTEKADNIFTVKVDKIAPEAVATTTTAESATSETSTLIAPSDATTIASDVTKPATPEPASLTATQPIPVTSEVAEAEVALTTSEESAKPAERTVYLSYITQYVNEDRQVVDSKGHLVAVKTTDETAKTQVTVSVSKDVPAGYELVQAKPEITLQLVEKQINVLAFVVTKKSEEEEIAESQLSNRDVLMRLSLEANLLADEALRQVAKEQAGNTELATAANKAKEIATNDVLGSETKTEEELGEQVKTVRASIENLAAEMLKVDEDGILTAMLDATYLTRPSSYAEIGTEAGIFDNSKPTISRYIFVFGTTEGTTESDANGTTGAAPIADKTQASRALVPAGTITNVAYDNSVGQSQDTLGSNLVMDNEGFLGGTFNHTAGGPYTRRIVVTDSLGQRHESNAFTTYGYTDKADSTPIIKKQGEKLTQDEVIAKMAIATTSVAFPNTGKNVPTVPEDEYSRTIVGYRLDGAYVEQTDISQFPIDKDYQVKVKTTNVYGQAIYNWVNVDYNMKASMPPIGVDPGVLAKNGDARRLEVLHVFGNVSGTTEAESTTGTGAPDFVPDNATKSFPITDPENDVVKLTYTVPANIATYEAGNPAATTYNGNSTADVGNLGKENTTQLLFDDKGRLIGEFPYSPGGLYSRIINMTDSAGNVSYSNPFFVVAYTDKRADDTPLIVAKNTALTENDIFKKLKIDTTSGGGPVNTALTVPESEYARAIVGYRTVSSDGTKGETKDTTSLKDFPTEGKYEVRAKTTNPYGQTIYNWVPVSIYKLEEVSRDTVNKYTDNPDPIHAITELGSSDTVGTVKLEGDLPADFNIANFNLKAGEAEKLAERNLEFVKADTVGKDGTVGTIRAKDGGKVEYTGSGNLDYNFEYTYKEDNKDKTSNFKYTILYIDTKAPVMTPKSEYIRFVNEEYTIKVPGTDNAFLSTEKIDGNLSVLKTGEGGKVSPSLGTGTNIASELDSTGKDISGGVDNQGGNSTKFNVNITGTAPSEEGTGDYKLRVGENNYPAGPAVEHVDGKVPENVSYTDLKVTFVKRAAVSTPVTVGDPANLTPEEKAAVIAQIKKDNADNERLKGLPDSAFTVNSDGTVSVDYSAGGVNVDGATDIIKNATTNLADTRNEAKAEIDTKLAEHKKAIEAKRDEAFSKIDDDISLRAEQRQAAKDAVAAAAGDALKELDNKATEAKENIDKATTVLEIDDAKTNGEISLDNAEDVGEKAIDRAKDKAEAIAVVENKAFEALEKVNSNPNLSDDDKQAHFDDINAIKDAAIEKINSTEDAEAITAAIDEAEIAYKEDILNAAQLDALNKLEKDSEETKAAIDANPNLTPEEKAKAIAKVDELVNNAESDILSKPTSETVQAVEDKADKDLAKVALQAAADDAKKGIEANPNLTPEEKESAKNAVEDAVKVATDAIDKASTPAEVDTATSDGVKAIDAEEFKATQKDAKNKIAKEAESAKKAIDDNPNLTPDEKESAKNAVEDAAKVATDAIDKASTPIAVQVEEHKGVAAINLITAKADAKGAVAAKLADEIKKLKDKQAEAEKAIDASTMTNEEKAIAKKALQDVVDKGKADLEDAARVATNEIHEATTTEKAKAAELAGEKSLTDTGKEARDAVELAKDKELAKEAIRTEKEEATKIVEKLAEDTLKAIKENPNLSDEAKEAEIKKLTDAVRKTLATICDNADKATQEAEKAQALADLEKAKETQKIADKAAIDELNLLVKDGELGATKRDVLNQLEKDAARAKEDIAKNPNLTKEQVDKALEDVQKDFDKAKTAINEATTPDAVQAEMDKGVAALAKDVLDAAKQDAKNKIAKDAAAAKEAIASNPNLSDEAKEAAKKAVDTDAQAATDAIDKALKPDAVQAEEDKGVAAITKDVLDAAKQDAKNKIAKDAAAAKEAIASNPNLTDAEKKTFTDAVDAEVAKANDAISAATSPADVQKEEDAGVAAIAEDVLDAAKQDAKNKIAKESDAAKSAIDANPNLTPEEKESAKKAIDTDAQAATAAIDKASTPDAVQVEEDKGVAAINLITAKADAKGVIAAKLADEIKRLEDKQAEAEKAIDASTMTNEEKAIAKKALQDVVDKGKAELEDAARVATNEIHKATTAEAAKATTLAGEKSLTDTGKEARDAVELAKDKELAKEAIRTEEEEATRIVEKLAENALKAINSDPNLSDEDKQAEIKKLTDVVTKTLETIHDNATKATQEAEKTQALADLEKVKETQKIADKAAIDGLTSLVKDGELEAMKQDVKNKIAKDAAAAKEAIGSNPNLTDAEKKTFTDAVDAEVAKANDAISAATSPADVQKEEDAGVAAIAEDVLDAAKQDAKNKIAKESDAAKSAIDAKPNLTDAEKESAKKAVDADAKVATDAIDASTSPVEAQSAEDKGVGSIAQDVLDAAKQDAKNKIAKESDAAKSAIDANPNLTDAEKESAKKAVDADAKAATEAIDASTSPVEAQSAE
ncbi:TPA: DUF1542 domain-containing protein, partial [Streptococcus suis]|nr:DUF1542 domain-containing protein [Streptococcus suis]